MPLDTDLSDRFELVEFPRAAREATFADDVRAGLAAHPKHLSSKYLYDELGSTLFEAITLVPEYYLTRAETQILRQWGWEIVRVLDAPLEFLELGSGSAIKTRLLIDEALRIQRTLRYNPIDISTEALYASSRALVERFDRLQVRGFAGDYFEVLASGALTFEHRVLAMFMGSNIGNYEPDRAVEILDLISRVLRPADGLLLGTDLKKDAPTLELAYDDPTGVTSSFNKNLLGRINRELGGNFDLRNFDHVVAYDERRGCVDSFLQAREACDLEIAMLGARAHFDAGERMHTESSYKFSPSDIGALAEAVGFRVGKQWFDEKRRFCVHLLVKR
jgi:dimethylhistidine N-methyltransferase